MSRADAVAGGTVTARLLLRYGSGGTGGAQAMSAETLAEAIGRTRAVCEGRLLEPDVRAIAGAFTRRNLDAAACRRLVDPITEMPASHAAVARLKASLRDSGGEEDLEQGGFERVLLLRAALDALPRVASLCVTSDVRRLFCETFEFVACADRAEVARYAVGTARFVEMCRTAALRRFPAGQFDWEVSGVRRSDVIRVELRSLSKAVAFLFLKMRGFGPVFFSHLNPRRRNRSLLEEEANRSYFRMAKSMELQPGIKGFAACSWFRSPGTQRVSPHLAWMSRVVLDHGGLVVESGRAAADSGVFHRSGTRRRLHETGRFTPRNGLVLWPREAMIAWAARHPEYGEPHRTL
jgi:hypothetical protein